MNEHLSSGMASATEKIPFHKLERAANAFQDGLGNVIRLGGLLGC
jgi:hypothetical protein